MYGDRNQLREQFVSAWKKTLSGETLDPLEAQLAAVISEHPEYHQLLSDRERALAAEFSPDGGQSNPFLHMAMHLSLREQAATDRPSGIRDIHRQLCLRMGAMAGEHRMLECLGTVLWEAQRSGRMPDEQDYLECLRRIDDSRTDA